MTDKDISLQLKEYVGKARKVYIVTGKNPDIDVLCSAVCLHDEFTLRDKEVTLFAPELQEEREKVLFGVENLFTYLPEQRTTVKVNVEGRGVKKVNYELKDNSLSFYITPREGQIYREDVNVYTPKLKADLVITLGVQKPENLTQWPHTWAQEFEQEGAVINIDNSPHNTLFGSSDVVEPTAKTMVQLIKDVIQKLEWNMSADSASILMQGLVSKTKQFTHNVDPEIFSLAAYLMSKKGKVPSKKVKEDVDLDG